MNLLPKTHEDFGKSEYWNSFFKKRGEKAFEWYGEYFELCGQLHKYIKTKDRILVVGCGNSKLSMDLYDTGFKDITNIDISNVVINQMVEINRKSRSDMKFLQMDATQMNFPDENFSVVLDKGTLDALMTDDSADVTETVERYCKEICRVLRNGGRFVCISLLQKHIANFVVKFFASNGCMFRVIRCFEAEQKNAEESSVNLPVFVIVATKFKILPQKILEVCLGGEKMQRLTSETELIEAISSVQKAALVCNGLNKGSIPDLNEVVIDLFNPEFICPRYTIYVLDQPPKARNGKYAAFIVPQGREVEWLFSTPKGRRKLLVSAKHNRLAIVHLHRDHDFTSWDSVKNELASSIRNLAPQAIKEQIPYLSLGADVGKRDPVGDGHSDISGDYRIEDVECEDGKIFRRLIFLNNQSVVQSEALIEKVNRKGKSEKKVNLGYLACQHHVFMTAGAKLAAKNLKNNEIANVLVIGLGGGGLCTFIHKAMRNIKLTAVEIDPAMHEVAKKYFELKEDNRLEVIIDDGLEFLKKSLAKYKAILFDVDSKDLSLGMSCPPKQFLDQNILDIVRQLIGNDGLFILNLVCRDENLRKDVVKTLEKTFSSVCFYDLVEDVNEIIYCRNSGESINLNDWKKMFEESSKDLNKLTKNYKLSKDDIIDVCEFIKDLSISN